MLVRHGRTENEFGIAQRLRIRRPPFDRSKTTNFSMPQFVRY